jgi:phosphoribosylformylglycinamidine synthase
MSYGTKIGAKITFPEGVPSHAFAFGEDQGRYVITVPASLAAEVLKQTKAAGIPVQQLGTTQDSLLEVAGQLKLPVSDLTKLHEAWMPAYMA